MQYILLVLATFAASAKSVVCKKIGQDNSDTRQVLFLNSNIFAIAAGIILLLSIDNIKSFYEVSAFSFWFSLVFAAFLLFTQIMQIYSMSRGFASLTSLIFSCGFLIPIFYSALFLDEPVSLYQIFGILILIGALVIVLKPSKDGKFSMIWLLFTVVSMLSSGTTAIIQKVHQNSEFKEELIPFIFYALLFASVFSLVFSFVFKGKADTKRCDVYKNKTALFLILADGAIVGVLNFVNLKLAGTIPAVIHFPVYNVASMMLTAVAGRLFFGERIGARKLIGFGIGLIAITMIGLL